MKLQTFKNIWEELNETVFASVLFPPRFYRTRSNYSYAAYVAGIDCESDMYFNLDTPGRLGRSTVYHEMVHQYLEEFLNVEEKDDHGPIFLKEYDKFKPSDVGAFDCD